MCWLPYYAGTDDTLPSSIFGGIINGTVMESAPGHMRLAAARFHYEPQD
ncbi:hypothetical protein [Desulfobulbus oralis]|nr:hypothetical protein [Desulfobulbus oralis]